MKEKLLALIAEQQDLLRREEGYNREERASFRKSLEALFSQKEEGFVQEWNRAREEARQADQFGIDLAGITIPPRTILDGIDFMDADLEGATLCQVGFKGAQFSRAKLSNANLLEASIEGAIFHSVDFRDAAGLRRSQLGKTDLSDAILPEYLKIDTTNIDKSARIARATMLTLIAVTIIIFLSILSVKDQHLFEQSMSFNVPLVKTKVEFIIFITVIPFLLVILYTYYLAQIDFFWDKFSRLPGLFDDGQPFTDHLFPWIFNDFVLLRSKSDQRHFFSYYRSFVFQVVTWFMVPGVLLFQQQFPVWPWQPG